MPVSTIEPLHKFPAAAADFPRLSARPEPKMYTSRVQKPVFPVLLSLLCGCFASTARKPESAPALPPLKPVVEQLSLENWPRIEDDLPDEGFKQAAAASIDYLKASPNRTVQFAGQTVGAQRLIETLETLVASLAEANDVDDLNRLLKDRFELYQIHRGTEPAHFSSYYQPTVEARKAADAEFAYPLYKRPDDLVEADLGAFDAKQEGKSVFGRMSEGKFVPYFDRADIDVRKSLEGKGLELAWLKSSFDRLNLHIQGSGRLKFEDGSEAMAAFAGTNGLPYKSVGLALAGSGAVPREELDAERLRKYLEEHPEGEAWLISQNPRYTFFQLQPIGPEGEPNGTIARPLTAGRSIAVDPIYTPLGAAAFIRLPMMQADAEGRILGKRETSRLVLAQDTGGAIKGPARVDLYAGHGEEAKATAHKVWEKGAMFVFLKKLPPRNR